MKRTPIRFCQDWTTIIPFFWVGIHQPIESLLTRKLAAMNDAEAIAIARRHVERAQ
jgi:hypothetical protein